MSFDPETLMELLPAINRTRDAGLAEALRRILSPADATRLLALEALAAPTPDEQRERQALRQMAEQCVLTPSEVVELADLEGLAAPTVAQQERTGQLREKASRGPLKALLTAFVGELAVLEENLEQLYDDLFIETCAPWVVPYIADLLGSEPLHRAGDERGLARAEVAHTIALRRRKGTAAALEQLARDLTGRNARVVEMFQLLATTQYMNHIRKDNQVTPSMRGGGALEWVGTAFDRFPHTLDVRRIASRRGRYNIPNIAIFLWRVDAHRLNRSPAVPEPAGDLTSTRWRFSPLGNDVKLHTRPEAEDEITHLAEPINVPVPISRRVLRAHLEQYYGPGKSLLLHEGATEIGIDRVVVCNLSDVGVGWAHDAPANVIAIDPVLGRLAIGPGFNPTGPILVTYHYGAIGSIGGGEYSRTLSSDRSPSVVRVPADQPTIQAAVTALGGAGVVEIVGNGRYVEALTLTAAADATLEVRAAQGSRPMIDLTAPMKLAGGAGSTITLDGLLIGGKGLSATGATNQLGRLELTHCTLVPGLVLGSAGAPAQPKAASLTVSVAGVAVIVRRSILGTMRVDPGSRCEVSDSIVDSCSVDQPAFAAPGGTKPLPGGELVTDAVTVIGTTACSRLEASNSIFLGTVAVTRRQEGCVRFSYLPPGSSSPRRYRCQPDDGEARVNNPRFTSLRYGAPAYGQLTSRTAAAIGRGADDESEMGAYHLLYQPQLEANLATRLQEFLRAGLQAGIFYAS